MATLSTCDSCIRFHPPVSRRAENVSPGFLSLLQWDSLQPFSARAATALGCRFRGNLRADLDTAQAERERKSLSGGRLLSEAWDLADPVYKVHPIVLPEGRSAVHRRGFAGRPLAGGHRSRSRPLTPELARCASEDPSRAGKPVPPGVRRPCRPRLGASAAPGIRSCHPQSGCGRGAMAAEVPEERWCSGRVARHAATAPPRRSGR
jgi:hypothetical protein